MLNGNLVSILSVCHLDFLQVEKAKNHYNGKKQLLVEAQEMNHNLENSLEASKREVKALETELTQTRMEVDQAKTKEKNLTTKVNSLEAQVGFWMFLVMVHLKKKKCTCLRARFDVR